MNETNRFQKKTLNKDDHKGMENGAKAIKGIVGAIGAVGLVVFNKDNLKTLGKGAVSIAAKVIKRS